MNDFFLVNVVFFSWACCKCDMSEFLHLYYTTKVLRSSLTFVGRIRRSIGVSVDRLIGVSVI